MERAGTKAVYKIRHLYKKKLLRSKETTQK